MTDVIDSFCRYWDILVSTEMPSNYKERRKHIRYSYDAGVQIRTSGGTGVYWATVSDISTGGCYVYTFSPLPLSSHIGLMIKAEVGEIRVSGIATTSHPGVGMGIQFTVFDDKESEERLKSLLLKLANVSQTSTV